MQLKESTFSHTKEKITNTALMRYSLLFKPMKGEREDWLLVGLVFLIIND